MFNLPLHIHYVLAKPWLSYRKFFSSRPLVFSLLKEINKSLQVKVEWLSCFTGNLRKKTAITEWNPDLNFDFYLTSIKEKWIIYNYMLCLFFLWDSLYSRHFFRCRLCRRGYTACFLIGQWSFASVPLIFGWGNHCTFWSSFYFPKRKLSPLANLRFYVKYFPNRSSALERKRPHFKYR